MLTKLESNKKRWLFDPDLENKMNETEIWLKDLGVDVEDIDNIDEVKYILLATSPEVYGGDKFDYLGDSEKDCLEQFKDELPLFQDKTYLNGKIVDPKTLTTNQILDLIDEGDLLHSVYDFKMIDVKNKKFENL